MEEEKIPKKEQTNQEEEYSFLQEVIKDEKIDRRKAKRGLLYLIGMGTVLGLAACFSFYAVKPWVESRFEGEPSQITIPKDEQEQEEEQPKPEESAEPGTESYYQMLHNLKDTAKETGMSIVEITGINSSEEWTKELNDSKHSVSGVIVADNGQQLLILGKICPVKEARQIRVTFAGGDRYEAVEIARDGNLGLAVYGVVRSEISEDTWSRIDTAILGNSNLVNEGDPAIVLGKPFGYANCYTYGTLALDMKSKNLYDGQYRVIYTDVVGTPDASGVIANLRGEVMGIIDQSLVEEDNRGAIAGYSVSDMKDVIELISNGQSVPYVGIEGIDVSEDMKKKEIPVGLYVKEVETESPAMQAGIQNSDVITAVDDEDIVGIVDYHRILMKKEKGSEIVLKGCRQGTGGQYVDIDFKVTVGEKK